MSKKISEKISEKITDMKANIMRLLTENTELKRERDEAMKLFESGKRACASLNEALDKTLHELREVREQNAKLRDIAERLSICAEDLEKYTWHCNDQGCDCGRCKLAIEQKELRAELQLKKEAAKWYNVREIPVDIKEETK